MAAWHDIRRSSRLRRCETLGCSTLIMPGDQYVNSRISPNHGDVGNVGWWSAALCRVCAMERGYWPHVNGAIVDAHACSSVAPVSRQRCTLNAGHDGLHQNGPGGWN